LPQLSRADLKRLRSLNLKKNREAEGLFIAEGVRVAGEAVAAGYPIEMAIVATEALLNPDTRLDSLLDSLEQARLFQTTRKDLDKALDSQSPQPIALVCRKVTVPIESLDTVDRSLVVICDRINNPGNLGAIVRVAAAAGADALVCAPGCADIHNPKCVRASAGAVFRLPVAECADIENIIRFIESGGYSLYGADMGGEDIYSLSGLEPKTALLLGGEAFGAGDSLSSACNGKVKIPMENSVESLNVAVAAGIVLYRFAELMRS
jgi:TrmH family RNA methyltransferase